MNFIIILLVVLTSFNSTITIEASEFDRNSATSSGGVLTSINSTITVEASEFDHNIADSGGGVLAASLNVLALSQ